MKRYFTLLCLVILSLGIGTSLDAQSGQLDVQIYQVDDTYYPDIRLSFQVLDRSNGRVVELNDNQLSATIAGQNLEISSFDSNPSTQSPTALAIVIDLTDSQSADFLDEQKQTIQTIIDSLNPADQIGLVTFDTDSADTPVPVSADHNAALNFVDTIEIVHGPINQFYDGVQAGIEALANVPANMRRAVVVLTDVENPRGNATPEAIVSNAQSKNAPIYLIGFNVADRSFLDALSSPTGGYTYMQRELEQEQVNLQRLAENVSEALTTEYELLVHSSSAATGAQDNLRLSIDINGASGEASIATTLRKREILISFPNLQTMGAVSDEIRFEPQIVYADNDSTPVIVQAEYSFESGGLDNELLRRGDTADTNYTWDIKDIAGGIYQLRLDVVDDVGNTASGNFSVQVASPISVRFEAPLIPANETMAPLEPGLVPVQVAITGDFPVNEVSLFADGTLIATLTAEPYTFEWDTRELAGRYNLRVAASDVQGNEAFAEIPVQVVIPEGPIYIIIALVVLAALTILVIVVIILRRQRKEVPQGQPAMPTGAPPVGMPPVGMPVVGMQGMPPPPQGAKLRVLSGGADSTPIYPLLPMTNLGRSREMDNHVFAAGESVSRKHAVITFVNGVYYFEDLHGVKENSSIKGRTLISGQRYPLQEGDHITMGQTQFLFTYQ